MPQGLSNSRYIIAEEMLAVSMVTPIVFNWFVQLPNRWTRGAREDTGRCQGWYFSRFGSSPLEASPWNMKSILYTNKSKNRFRKVSLETCFFDSKVQVQQLFSSSLATKGINITWVRWRCPATFQLWSRGTLGWKGDTPTDSRGRQTNMILWLYQQLIWSLNPELEYIYV